jgi:hypothetical protein
VEVINELSAIPELFRNSVIVFSSCDDIRTVTERCQQLLRPAAMLVHLCYLNNELDPNATRDLLTVMESVTGGESHPPLIVNAVVCKVS